MTQNKRMAKKRRIRKLEELNLMDDFLFQELVAQEGDGEEFVRILLKTILGRTVRKVKIVPQKNIFGIDTDRHGIQYDKLQNVIIIVILPYDPFDKNRMVYTVQNQCVEDVSVPYDDGAKKIFLYTKGAEGNPSQEFRDMLKYIEVTTEENVTNQDIESVNRLVNKLKQKREVGINYMKSWEREEKFR